MILLISVLGSQSWATSTQLLFFFLRGRVSLCNPVWTQIHDPPASASGVARSTVLYHHTWLQSILSTLLFTAEFLAKYPITVVLVFCCCDKIPYKSNLKEEIFILDHGFRLSVNGSPTPLLWVWDRTLWHQGQMAEESAHFMVARKQQGEEESRDNV
jgi:hypothetical protein